MPTEPSTEAIARLSAAIGEGLRGELRPEDRFVPGSDPRLARVRGLNARYLGGSAGALTARALARLLGGGPRGSLIVAGVDTFLLALPAVLDELAQSSPRTRLSAVVIDPNPAELCPEAERLSGHAVLSSLEALTARVEDVSGAQWERVAALPRPAVAFANFCMHYVALDERQRTLASMRASVDSLLMIERDLGVAGLARPEASAAVYSHFAPQFERVERLVPPGDDREALYGWLSVLVRDALVPGDRVVRTHLCESLERWAERLRAAGFSVPAARVVVGDAGPAPGVGLFAQGGEAGPVGSVLASASR